MNMKKMLLIWMVVILSFQGCNKKPNIPKEYIRQVEVSTMTDYGRKLLGAGAIGASDYQYIQQLSKNQ